MLADLSPTSADRRAARKLAPRMAGRFPPTEASLLSRSRPGEARDETRQRCTRTRLCQEARLDPVQLAAVTNGSAHPYATRGAARTIDGWTTPLPGHSILSQPACRRTSDRSATQDGI